uniref:J domain-containing protein n=1 Tax=Trichobilharzia regenti TaxID=157069 RepID=A0AA85JIB8_TRIRE|nr:unnamed protein product [Trichobilharzia regenti]
MVSCYLVSGSRKCRISNLFCQMSRYFSRSSEIKDYYAILNVKSTASQEEIKEAYLDLSKKYHPDRCNDEGSKMRFAEISEAYSILGKVESRREFDTVRKINAFGVSSDAFRMQYPKPPSDLDKVGLEAYENEMRRLNSFLNYDFSGFVLFPVCLWRLCEGRNTRTKSEKF